MYLSGLRRFERNNSLDFSKSAASWHLSQWLGSPTEAIRNHHRRHDDAVGCDRSS